VKALSILPTGPLNLVPVDVIEIWPVPPGMAMNWTASPTALVVLMSPDCGALPPKVAESHVLA
jgi:hypothetical protein